MDAFLEALASLNLWQVIGAALAVVAGSSAASSLISGWFENHRVKSKLRRDARSASLTSIGHAYAVYLTVGNAPSPQGEDASNVAEAGAIMLSETAKVGKGKHLIETELFRTLGERFAGQDEDVNAGDLREAFLKLITAMSNGIKK